MDDDDWRTMREPWEHVKWARLHWQRSLGHEDNAAEAARALGMKDGTYRAYERSPDKSKAIKLTFEMATAFSEKFKVSRLWLLEAKGSPFDRELPASQQQIVQMLSMPDVQRALANISELLTNLRAPKGDK